MSDKRVLIDSDAFIGLQIQQDAHRQQVIDNFAKIRSQGLEPLVTTLVVAETASLLSRRYSLSDAKRFLSAIETIPIIVINEDLHKQSVSLFQEQTRSKTSLVDMSNVVVMKQYQIPQIFAFDKVYGADFQLKYL